MRRRSAALLTGAALAVGVAATYRLPPRRAGFEELYADVDTAVTAGLRSFRTRVPVQRVTLHGQDWEHVVLGDGPSTVVFLHGMAGAYDIWWQQLEALAPTHRTISVTYPPVHTLAELAEGVLGVLEAHGAGTASLVGSSLGGYLAQYLVQQHPQRIERAVLANTFPPNDHLREAHRLRAAVGRFLPERVVAAAFRDSNTRTVLPASQHAPLVAAYLAEQGQLPGLKHRLLARYHTVIEPFVVADPAPEGIELLLIQSDNDPLLSDELQSGLRDTYRYARVHTFHDGGHFPYLHRAAEYTSALRDFLG